jgi:hypothetical protein
MYLHNEVDLVIIAGDLNCRIGKDLDYIPEIDNVPSRRVLDEVTNQHGRSLIEFLHESNMCILNGRFNEKEDGFTSISTKGTAVVDYIMCPIHKLDMFKSFTVEPCLQIVDRCELNHLVGQKSRIPDHALLTCEFSIAVNVNPASYPREESTEMHQQRFPKYKV